ncbi:MAG: peptidyl-prolyl cis-trans isomerase SurA [Pyrinomonadaceae bacterium]|nr:peptidyl-prolyl cis-trans isomerase SurA [Pyrinomonadaceae bacterium]
MKSKFLITARRVASAALLLAAFLAPSAVSVQAQEEGVPRVIDEVIAQVNADVITLSMLRKDMAEAAEALQQQRGWTAQQANEEIAKRRAEIIATLVNEQLLVQKGKEMGMNEDVEAEVNRRMLDVAKRENLKSLALLEQAMRESKIDPAAVRATMRTEIMKTWVLGREVDQKIFYGLTDSEVKSYYEANKEKFRKPESVVLSEIFLSTVGKDPKEVRERADKLAAQLRAGADFGALAMVQSEREVEGKRTAPENKGKLGTYSMNDITKEDIANALKNVKAGGVSNPIETEGGIIILRVDERTPAGEAVFDDNQVREAITVTRMEKERKTYLENLRRDAYIEIAKDYQADVLPLLKVEPQKSASTTTPAAAPKKDDKKKSEANGNKKP